MTEKNESVWFRGVIGIMAMIGGLAGFGALFVIEIPQRNENALLLALGFVMGWAGAVVASEYGSTSTGRKIADSAIRNSERLAVAAIPALDAPLDVTVTNAADNPVPTIDEGKA